MAELTAAFGVTPADLGTAAAQIRGWAAMVGTGLSSAAVPDAGDPAVGAALGAVVTEAGAGVRGLLTELAALADVLAAAAARYAAAEAAGVPAARRPRR